MIELGFPFSDPLADGPVIQRASERALGRGMRTAQCLECLAETRALVGETPIVPMTYAALLEAYGWERFAADAARARRDEPDRLGRPGRPATGAPADPPRRADLDRRADPARRVDDRRLALPRHADGHDRRARRALVGARGARRRARDRSRTACRSTPGSASRRPSRPRPRRRSPTGSSSARARPGRRGGAERARDVRREPPRGARPRRVTTECLIRTRLPQREQRARRCVRKNRFPSGTGAPGAGRGAASRLRPDPDEHLADVRAGEHADERLGRPLDPVDDRLAMADRAVARAAARPRRGTPGTGRSGRTR